MTNNQETSCGLGSWRPKFLQVLASKKVYMFFYGAIGIVKVEILSSKFQTWVTSYYRECSTPISQLCWQLLRRSSGSSPRKLHTWCQEMKLLKYSSSSSCLWHWRSRSDHYGKYLQSHKFKKSQDNSQWTNSCSDTVCLEYVFKYLSSFAAGVA